MVAIIKLLLPAVALSLPQIAACQVIVEEAGSVAQYALDEVLLDAAEVFGVYDYSAGANNGSSNTATWMSQVPDSTLLAHMNIPGTHDSATWNLTHATLAASGLTSFLADPRFYRCHDRSMADMLRDGVRFFDLRYNLDPTGQRLVFWHSMALLSETATLESVLFAFYRWLDAHPSETVIISLQLEAGSRAGTVGLFPTGSKTLNATEIAAAKARIEAKAQRDLLALLTSPAARSYILQTRDELGSLGAARGRAILFRRFTLDSSLGPGHDALLPGLHLGPDKWRDNNPGFEIVYAPPAPPSNSSNSSNSSSSSNSTANITTTTGIGNLTNSTTSAHASSGTAYISDLYAPASSNAISHPTVTNASVDIDLKFSAVSAHLSLAAGAAGAASNTSDDSTADALYITFASGEHDFAAPPVFPEIMALGNGTEATLRGGVNEQLLPLLRSLAGKRLGIVVLDFYEKPQELVAAVLGR